MEDDNENVIRFGVFDGDKQDKDTFPTNAYNVEDIDGNNYAAEGYLIFTSQHVCVMENVNDTAIPALMVPLSRVKVVELIEFDEN